MRNYNCRTKLKLMLRKIIVILSFIGIIGLFVVVAGFLMGQAPEPETFTPPEIKKYVKTTTVKYKTVQTEVIAYGRVKAAESLDLISEKSGRIYASIPLKEGTRFAKGDLLFRIDDTEARLNLQSQMSNFLRDLANILPDFRIDFPERYETWNNYFNSIDLENPLPKLPETKSAKEKTFLATKNIFSAYYNIKSSEEGLRKHRFYAPFNGTITGVNLQNGSFVNPGNNIGAIVRTDRQELKVDVEVEDISWIRQNQKIWITTEDQQQRWSGYITRISDVVNENTQSIDVYVALEPNKNRVYDGLFLRTEIPGKRVSDAMEMPRSAVLEGNRVYVVQDSLLKVVDIDIHRVNQESIVFSGLDEGTDLVIEPLLNAYNNMKVFKLEEEESSDDDDKDIDVEMKSESDTGIAKN